MTLHESDTGRTSPNSEDPTDAKGVTQGLPHALAELVKRHCEGNDTDALCYFLKTHACIYERVRTAGSPRMLSLNALFADRCFRVCNDFLQRQVRPDLCSEWYAAFDQYVLEPSRVVSTLAQMAKAHILCDLPVALCALESNNQVEIQRTEYDSVLDHIVLCLNEVGRTFESGGSLEDAVVLALLNHFALVRAIRDTLVQSWRDEAWEDFQHRKRVMRWATARRAGLRT